MKQFSFLLILATFLVLDGGPATAQLVGDNLFFPGAYLEVGQAPNGSLGTTRMAPTGYSSNSPGYTYWDPLLGASAGSTGTIGHSTLAMVYDQGHDGFTVGTPAFFGDYTLPGTPYEGWGIEVGGVRGEAHLEYLETTASVTGYQGGLGLSGTNTSYSSTGGQFIGTWTGNTSGGLNIVQTTEVDSLASWVIFNVTMTNTTGTAMSNVYYMRGCDPDNDSYTGGSATTTNTINYQGDYANRVMVTAAGTHYTSQTLSLLTKDCRAKCFIEPSWPITTGTSLASVYAATSGYVYTGSDVNDYAIGIVWSLGTIAPGASVKLSYSYAFDGLLGIDSAITSPQLVTLGSPHDTTDTVTSCAFTGDTLYANIVNATTGNWAGSTWTWAPATGLIATTGTNSGVLIASVTGVTTYTITGTAASVYGACNTKTFLLTVTPAGPPPPPLVRDTSYCQGATAGRLTAIGAGLMWYTVPTGGVGSATAPIPSTATIGTTTYYVSQTIAGCLSPRAAINVTIIPLPSVITGPTAVCPGSCISLADATTGGTWSSGTPSLATISSTGVACGVSAGLAIISYSVSSGCSITATINVVALPPPISGVFTVCQFATTALGDVGGGSWSSSNMAVATVGTSGTVTGVTAGTAIITYSIGTGCNSTAIVTVNPAPSAISGTLRVCSGLSTPLTDVTPGGTWASSNPLIASVGSTTGRVTGGVVSFPSTAVITYTAPGGCSITATVTVNPLPGAIASVSTVCAGSTIALLDGGGGTWSSSNPSIATVGSSSGIVGGVASSGGAVTITYTLATGCDTTTSITVSPVPLPITGTAHLCEVTGTTVLSDATPGGYWTSGDPSIATVDPFSGTVYGVLAGVDTITYNAACAISIPVTVDPSPPTIVGPSNICAGAPGTLTDAITGGTWSSSNTTIASVGLLSGIVTGGAVTTTSSVTITYTAPSGCFTSTSILVYPPPTSITGTAHVCVLQTTLLSGLPTGGAWSSGSPLIATITPGPAGTVTGVSAGTTLITYTLGTGCSRTTVVTVNAAPGIIGGLLSVCVGSTNTLTDAGTGTWTSSNPAAATIGLSTGVVGGVAPGTTTITYSLGGTCVATAIVTVNALPSPFTITGGGTICAGGTGVPIGISGSTVGIHYQLDSAGNPLGAFVVGTGGVLSFGLHTGAGTYTVVASNPVTGCSRTMTGTVTITITPAPTPFTVTGGGTYCSGTTGVHIGLLGSSVGVSYRLFNGTTPVGTAIPGTGSSLDFGVFTGAGTYTVVATAGTCTATMPGSATITISPLPNPFTMSGGGPYCAGGTGVHIILNNSQTGVSYQLLVGTVAVGVPLAGTGAPLDFGLQTTAGTYTIVATNTTTGCSRVMTGSETVTISPIPVISGATAVCVTAVISESVPTGSTGGTWISSTPTVATIGSLSGLVTGVLTGTTTITYTSPAGCVATTVVTVSPSPGPISGPNSVCALGTVTETDIVLGGLWTSSNTSVATVGSGGVVSGVATGTTTITYSLGSGCTVTKVMTVTPAPGAITGATVICAGACNVFTDATTGGTWSSSIPGVATVSSGGSVCGVSPGTSDIIYTLGGCTRTTTVTVNSAPGAISGPASVCVGSTITETDAITGGTWTSGTTTVATVDPASGIVTGVAGGTSNLTYSLGGSCVANKIVTVNPISAIAGSPGMCVGTTTILTDGAGPGSWTSSNTAVATVTGTGTVSAVSPGTSTIVFTTTAGCTASVVVTVNTAPSVITGTLRMCVGVCDTLSNTATGGTWSSSTPGIVSAGSSSGVVCGLSSGTSTITYSLGSGCIKTAIVTVNPITPAIGGTPRVCIGASTALTDPTTGGTWSSGTTSVATVTPTTGIVWGVSPGTSTITYSPPTGCAVTMVVTVNPVPTAILGTTSICVGSCTTLSDAVSGGTWSGSSTATATVNSATGQVCGVSPGFVTITYHAGSCTASTLVTVLPPPPAITGGPMVCEGQSTALSDASTGGTWSTGDAHLATINATTGVLWGVSSGTVIVSYTIGTGCTVIGSIIVDALSPITGSSTVCQGLTTTLTDTTGAGTWSSSDITIATATTSGVNTGLIGGVNPGTVTITYTLPTGCAATHVMTVNPAPPAITGVSSICLGSTTTLSDGVTGGSWFSSNASVATVTPGGGVVTGTGTGTANITYTVPGTGCPAVTTITVNAVPAAIDGPGDVCIGSTIPLTEAMTGGTWSSSAPLEAAIDPITGVVTGLSAGTGITIIYTAGGSGCTASITINVDAAPAPIAGPTGTICPGATITLTDVTTGGSWSSSNTSVATVDAFGNVTGTPGPGGTAIISYTTAAGCSAMDIVSVNPSPGGIGGTTTLCQGTTTTLTDGTGGGTWMSSDTSVAHIDTTTGLVSANGTGSTTITYTTPAGCTITTLVFVNAAPDPLSGSPAICLGNTTTLADATSGGTWSSTNTTVATVDIAGIVYGVTVGTSTISYTSGVCAATIVVTVNALPGTISGPASVCYGSTITLGDIPTGGTWTSSDPTIASVDLMTGVVTGRGALGGSADITYSLGAGCTTDVIINVNQLPDPIIAPAANVCAIDHTIGLFETSTDGVWSSTNTTVASVSGGIVTSGLTAGTTTISYTSTTTGCAAIIVITVNPQPASITGPTQICLHSTITLSDVTAGGIWTSSDPTIAAISSPSVGIIGGASLGAATISYTLPAGCRSQYTVTVDSLPTVFTVTGGGPYCEGGTGADISLSGSSVGVNYLLYHGSTATGTFAGIGSLLDFGLQRVAGPYTVIGISTATGCSNIMAGSVSIVINPSVVPSVSVHPAAGDTVCSGTSTTYTALQTNGGVGATYVWNVDGTDVGTGSTYTFVPADGDVVMVTMAADTLCASPTTTSGHLTMRVFNQEMPVANVSVSPSEKICQGTAATFTALPLFGGTAPVYAWFVNGVGTGAGPAFTYVPTNGDSVYVSMISNYLCRLATTVQSTPIAIAVDTPTLPLVTITASPGTSSPIGEFDTLTATVVNGGPHPGFQWVVNELPVAGATSNVFISNTFSHPDEDSVTCIVTSDGICQATSFAWVYVSLHPAGVSPVSAGGIDISVLPNPNKGEFVIRGTLGTTTDEEVSLELTDLLGQVVYLNKVTAHGGKLNEHVSLGKNIANGMYMLNLRSASGDQVFHIVVEQ